jgi:hypothetical protein
VLKLFSDKVNFKGGIKMKSNGTIQIQEKRYVTTAEASKILGLAKGTLSNMRIYGGGPNWVKLKKAVFYDVQDLIKFMEEHKVIRDENQ